MKWFRQPAMFLMGFTLPGCDGTDGLDAAYEAPHEAVKEWLLEQGFSEGRDLKVKKCDGAGHRESSWRARVGEQLQWLLAYPGRCFPACHADILWATINACPDSGRIGASNKKYLHRGITA